jgi:tRNA (guanosine-2'-O-)-methyltransferase
VPGQIRKKTELRRRRAAFEDAFPVQRSLSFLLQDWDDGYNVGGLFRVAAACGAEEIVMVGRTPVPPDPRIAVTSLGFHRRVAWRRFSKWADAVAALREEGRWLVAIEVAEGAQHYMSCEYGEKSCLVLGSEGCGLTPGLLRACDAVVAVPMYGKGRSLNVHVAGAIVAFEAMMRGSEGTAP